MVREKENDDWGDRRNASLGLGCYCLDATYENVEYVFDATASINDPGRYINHARRNFNLFKMPPVLIGKPTTTTKDNLKIGFVAKKDIANGDELFFNYGLKNDPEFPWISSDAKDIGTSLDKLESPSVKYACRLPPHMGMF